LKPVLVIDDEPDIRNMIKLFLEEDGYEVVTAEDGVAGMNLFTEILPHVVVTDIRMPVMDGTEVLKQIKKSHPDTEVIVITAHGEMKLAIQALQNNASDFIQKPFGYDVLSVAVKRAFRKIKIREDLAQAQLQLMQAEKMASLGQLAAGIAHEINNPVGFVNSNLGTLRKYADNILQFYQEIQRLLNQNGYENLYKSFVKSEKSLKIDFILRDIFPVIDESLEGTSRVKHIVQDLKNFSHIDIKRMTAYDINNCILSTINILSNEIKHKVTIEKELGELPQVVCFPQQINQVILNLLMNGIQAVEKDGVIKIRTFKEYDSVAIEISDNGCGIPKSNLNKIFDPFFTTKEVGKGTGLGLHIVYGIVHRHGGSIEVKSKVGQGTVFTVHLPLKPPDYEAA